MGVCRNPEKEDGSMRGHQGAFFLRIWEIIMLKIRVRNIDITMMAALNAREREQGDWAILFSTADPRFKFLGARKPENSRMWIIEAVWEGDGPAE